MLFDFVKGGEKQCWCSTQPPDEVKTANIAPYPLKNFRQVTEENAAVQFLAPNHPVLNYPNKITSTDFEGWTQA
jgi:hypothetical protein